MKSNYHGFETIPIPTGHFFDALTKDKKNQGTGTVTLILLDKTGQVFKEQYRFDENFQSICADYFQHVRQS